MINNPDWDFHQAVIFAGAVTVLQALKSGKASNLRRAMSNIYVKQRVTLQRDPSHCGVYGNERTDDLLKKEESAIKKK